MKSELRIQSWKNIAVALLFAFASGCAYNMSWQPHYKPDERSALFSDGRSERPVVEGTVPRSQGNGPFFTGLENGEPVDKNPMRISFLMLRRGRERFDIYCSPCHSRIGDGQGMVVQRGFPSPPSYHNEDLRNAPDGRFFQVIANGFGRMHSYANRVDPADRWRIIAYIRALQLSRNATGQDISKEEMQKIIGLNK